MDVPCFGAGEVIACREVNRPAIRETAAFGVVDILVAGKTVEHGLTQKAPQEMAGPR